MNKSMISRTVAALALGAVLATGGSMGASAAPVAAAGKASAPTRWCQWLPWVCQK